MKYPVIATRGVIVFPGHSTLLEIGRKMSMNAVDLSVIQHEAQLVVVSQRDVLKDSVEGIKDIFEIGTLVSLKIEKQTSNHKTISIHGLERVKISNLDFNNGHLLEADIKVLKSIAAENQEEQAFINVISQQLEKSLGQMINMPKNVLSSLASGITAPGLSDIVGQYLPLPLEKRQILLETLEVNERLNLVNKFMVEETQIQEIERGIDQNIRSNLDGQQREYLLREKMKAIKEELGELSSKDSEVDRWREELESPKFPKEVREKALEEIKRYEAMPPISAEAHVSKGYIDWIMKLPWKTYSEDNKDLNKAKAVLNKHHYGLKKVKERIIEHLAVKINTNDAKSPILTLVGPPGVGKTSLGKSIAEAVDREFIKVSLGGVTDESEIRGHRRTYVGALPGKIIQAINKAKTSNPIILLDEIDKLGASQKGDPTSALLEVLDPEQNKDFQDHYIELGYDLSKVMFIATANYFDRIPGPLADRVETIWLDQYTSEEKLSIAKDYIIPTTIKEHNLSKTSFKISDKVIEYIIDKYTREAGVRGLQRTIAKLARKIVLLKLEDKIKGAFTITEEKVEDLLGKQQVFKEKLEGNGEVGLTNGMYYSATGGGVLPIEVTTYPAKTGAIKLTGSVKDVMKESLNIAVGYLRSNSQKFGIKFDWDKTIIQVHVPEGATPKDGPSAGIAFTTALLSALTGKKVPREIALTGEITLRGKVLMIGGLKEKTLGAVEAGVRKIYIPETNKKDLDELAKKVKDVATIIPVKDYSEVYKSIFA